MRKWFNRAAYVIVVVTWVPIAVLLLYHPEPPYQSIGEDFITPPATVQYGNDDDRLGISRSYRITRKATMQMERVAIQGDCTVKCDIVELPSSMLEFKPGEYHNSVKEHALPNVVTPGHWAFRFTLVYKDFLGRPQSIVLPPLAFEVLPP